MSNPPGLLVVTRVGTGGSDWLSKRLEVLARLGLSVAVAQAIVAMWGLESDDGRSEWNFNVGNRIANHGDLAYALDVPGEGRVWFKSYTNLEDAAHEYIALIKGSYSSCWEMLQESPTGDAWVRCLGLQPPGHRYYKADTPAEVDRYARGYLARYKQLFPNG